MAAVLLVTVLLVTVLLVTVCYWSPVAAVSCQWLLVVGRVLCMWLYTCLPDGLC